ncbi:MAG: gliding motility-associated C-terminal domain-containing protein [Flavobacteriales bacterium]|nr:gliding motility-associated C-terminal domain-containing protein [Flavobacteriales bacterium]
MNQGIRFFGSVSMIACAIIVQAQNPLPDSPGYDAWKASVAPPPLPPPVDAGEVIEAPVGHRSNCDCWIPPDATYTLAMGPNDDSSSPQIALPFNFFLYGTNYNSVYINNNGNLSFGSPYGAYSASGFPSANYVMVAPFWGDVDTRPANGGQVWYKVTPTALYVNWVAVGYYSMQTDMLNSFQVIITNASDPVVPNGANVSFCYEDMQWTTGAASGGVGGFGGTPATVGANKGDGVNYMQFGRFDHAGVDYDGPFGVADGVSWLDYKYLSFTTNQTQANVPPVITSQSVCDSMTLCVGELATLSVTFLSPEPAQITTATTLAPTLSNWTVTSNTPGLTADITVDFTPLPADIGYHTVVFTGTDDGTPSLSSSLNVVIHVIQGGTIPPGSLSVCDNGAAVNLLTDVLGPAAAAGGNWTDPAGAAHSGTYDPSTDAPGDYLYAVLLGGNCASLGTATITEVAHAWAGNNVTGVYCSDGVPVDLFGLLGGAPQATGAWTSAVGQVFSGTLDPTMDGTGNYTYVVTGAAPCPNDTAVVAITVNQYVDAGLPNALTLCEDATPLNMLASLNGSPTPGGIWTAPNGTQWGGTWLASIDPQGIFTYTVTSALPCLDHSTTLTVAMDPAPWAGDDGTITKCANDGSVTLFPLLGGSPDVDGYWEDPTQASNPGTLVPHNELSGNYVYIVLGTATCAHLIDTALVAALINPLPRIAFVADPDSGCNPLQVQFTNTTPAEDVGDPCLWNFGDGQFGADCVDVTHIYQDPGSYHVRLKVTTPAGCTDELLRYNVVLVDPAPVATFRMSPDPGTPGNSTIFFTAEDDHPVYYGWSIDGIPYTTGQQANHWFNAILGSEHLICLNVYDRYGCADTLCRTVEIIVPSIFVENAFTPDGDGINDKFLPHLMDIIPAEHVFQVFDRWGGIIFSSEDPTEGWDGRANNSGDILQQGVYVWRLEALPRYQADKLEFIGSVTLIK